MADGRGPLFRLLGLHGFRCYTCRRDVLWRRKMPVVCRWCGGLAIDVPAIIKKATTWVAAFVDELRKLGVAMATTSDQVKALSDACRALGVPAQRAADRPEVVLDETPLLTRVDIPPEQV